MHQSKKVKPDFKKVTMKFWIPSSTWLPSTPKRTWLLSIHTEKTRCIVFYTRQRVHAYHTHWGDEATHAKCWPYGRYQPRHHFRESEFFVLQWTLQHLWLCLVLISEWGLQTEFAQRVIQRPPIRSSTYVWERPNNTIFVQNNVLF